MSKEHYDAYAKCKSGRVQLSIFKIFCSYFQIYYVRPPLAEILCPLLLRKFILQAKLSPHSSNLIVYKFLEGNARILNISSQKHAIFTIFPCF